MTDATSQSKPVDPKIETILKAAWGAFATYGFRKTSMDDIARAAGMSRAALYLHYRNKEDIFRSLVTLCYDLCETALTNALQAEGDIADVLETAFLDVASIVVEPMLASPHGMELLDAGTTAAADLVEQGEAGLRRIYTAWFTQLQANGQARLPVAADELALMVTASLKGAKVVATGYDEYQRIARALAHSTGAALKTV